MVPHETTYLLLVLLAKLRWRGFHEAHRLECRRKHVRDGIGHAVGHRFGELRGVREQFLEEDPQVTHGAQVPMETNRRQLVEPRHDLAKCRQRQIKRLYRGIAELQPEWPGEVDQAEVARSDIAMPAVLLHRRPAIQMVAEQGGASMDA